MKIPNWMKSKFFLLPLYFVGLMSFGDLLSPKAKAVEVRTPNPFRPYVTQDGSMMLPQGETLHQYVPTSWHTGPRVVTRARDGYRVYCADLSPNSPYEHVMTIKERP